MELVRVTAPLAGRCRVAEWASEHTILFECSDASTVLVAASIAEELRAPLGLWLTVGADYPAQLAARDVATLSRLVELNHVAIEAASVPDQHAAVVRALLVEGEVNFTNDVVALRGAYNRPAPPAPVSLWTYQAEVLVGAIETLRVERRESRDGAELAYYVSL